MKFIKKLTVFLLIIFMHSNIVFAKKVEVPPGSGYVGTLPNIESYFEHKKEEAKFTPQTKEFKGEKGLLKAPMDDSLFVDIILKKGKPTQYVNEMLDMVSVFENFRTSLNKEITLQQFNAQVNGIDLRVKRLMQNYGETSHALSESYIWCQQVNYRAKVLGNLMYDANYFSKYMPISNTQYSKESIESQKEELIKELDKAIFVLKRLDE